MKNDDFLFKRLFSLIIINHPRVSSIPLRLRLRAWTETALVECLTKLILSSGVLATVQIKTPVSH